MRGPARGGGPDAGLDGVWAEVAALGGGAKLDPHVGYWVEFTDTAYADRREPLPPLRVEELDLPGRRVRSSLDPHPSVRRRPAVHPYLRRWDRRPPAARGRGGTRTRGGALRIGEGAWIPLEDGVFVPCERGGTCRPAAFWTVAARTAAADAEWPADVSRRPLPVSPHGVGVHHAPLAWVLGGARRGQYRRSAPGVRALGRAGSGGGRGGLAAEAGAEEETVTAERAANTGSPDPDSGQNDQGRSES